MRDITYIPVTWSRHGLGKVGYEHQAFEAGAGPNWQGSRQTGALNRTISRPGSLMDHRTALPQFVYLHASTDSALAGATPAEGRHP